MKRVGLISGFILPGYEALHTQSREHVTEDVLGALHIWEQKCAYLFMHKNEFRILLIFIFMIVFFIRACYNMKGRAG